MSAIIVYEIEKMDPDTLPVLLGALVDLNLLWLRKHPDAPNVYDAGVRYVRERPGQEKWIGIGALYRRKKGDCEDIACALAAWYQFHGRNVRPIFTWRVRGDGTRLYHILCEHPDTTREDACRKLGM